MIPYWLFFALPAYAAAFERPAQLLRRSSVPWIFFLFALTLAIGLRFEVGGDWGNYLAHLQRAHWLTLPGVLEGGDPGYVFLNWLAAQLGVGVWFVNLVCGALFSLGLVAFCREQPRPFLALTVAIPYLVIVVAMGYTRQSVAIGLVMMALVALARGRTMHFLAWVAVGALFHKTAVVIVPIAFLAATEKRFWTAIWVGGIGLGMYVAFLDDSVEGFVQSYVVAEYESQGAAIRVAMNAIPAAIFLLYRHRLVRSLTELKLWTYLSLGAIGFVPLLLFTASSTAVDRMALYLIPLQLFVLSRLPEGLSPRGRHRREIVAAVLLYSAAIQFVWLNYASHADAWLPYRPYFLQTL